MNFINDVLPALELITAVSTGVLVGALLTEANVLVPYWRRMPPKDFLDLHHTMAPSLFRFFAPITIAGTVLPVLSFLCAFQAAASNTVWWGVSALFGMVMLVIYFAYFKGANNSFETGSCSAENVPSELSNWARWHNIRTGIAFIGFVSSIIAISLGQ